MVRCDRVALVLFVAALAACSGAPEPSGSPSSTSASPVGASAVLRAQLKDPVVVKELRDVALVHALRAGVASPRSIHAVAASDHQNAETVVSGAVIADHDPVIVVQMEGGPFTATTRPPNGAAPPQGDVLTITFDAASHRVTDIGYDASPADLRRIDAEVIDLLAP